MRGVYFSCTFQGHYFGSGANAPFSFEQSTNIHQHVGNQKLLPKSFPDCRKWHFSGLVTGHPDIFALRSRVSRLTLPKKKVNDSLSITHLPPWVTPPEPCLVYFFITHRAAQCATLRHVARYLVTSLQFWEGVWKGMVGQLSVSCIHTVSIDTANKAVLVLSYCYLLQFLFCLLFCFHWISLQTLK